MSTYGATVRFLPELCLHLQQEVQVFEVHLLEQVKRETRVKPYVGLFYLMFICTHKHPFGVI